MPRYYQVSDDVHVPGRWYLVDPVDRHGNELSSRLWEGKPLQLDAPVRVHHSRHAPRGRALDFTEIDGGPPSPVVHPRVAEMLSRMAPADVQLLPAQVEGESSPFYIVNVIRVLKCIDERASRYVELYADEDAELYADRIGQYQDVRGMRISPSQVGDAKVFRTWGWLAIVVSEEIKEAFEGLGVVGVKFEEV